MNASTMKYLAIGGGALLLFIAMRGNSGGGMTGAGLTASSLAGAQSVNLQLSQITAARDAAADIQQTARLGAVVELFKVNSVGANTITAQFLNTMATLQKGAMDNSTLLQTSIIGSELAKSLAGTNLIAEKMYNDTSIAMTKLQNENEIALAKLGRKVNKDNQQYALARQMDNNGSDFLDKMFTF